MRLLILAASALAFAACSPSAPATDGAKPADTPAAATPAAHDMAAMDSTMKSADATDDANTAETPEGYTFHTYPAKVESVHLPTADGAVWTATVSDAAFVDVTSQADEKMPDGKMHHVVKVTPKKAGNATIKFERRASADTKGAVTETRTINFMVH
jgi:hypothetical protein